MVSLSGEDYFVKALLEKTKIKEVMRSPVVTVNEEEDVSEVYLRFKNNNSSHLCVTNRVGQLMGVVSQKYLYKTQSPRKRISDEMEYREGMVMVDDNSYYEKDMLDSYILRNIMNRNPVTLEAGDSMADAIRLMNEKNLGCIPIVDKSKQVVGVLTDREVVRFIARVIEA